MSAEANPELIRPGRSAAWWRSVRQAAGGRGSRQAWFIAGFLIASAVALFAMLFALSGIGPAGSASSGFLWLLLANLALIAVLGAVMIQRVLAIARGGEGQPAGGRLHLRFVTLFSLAAVVPTLIVALFLGVTVSRGVQSWFSERVRTVVESSVDVARSYIDESAESIRAEMVAMARDLNAAAPMLSRQPDQYQEYLIGQAMRRNLAAAYVIDGQGRVLSAAESLDAPAYRAPQAAAYAQAREDVLLSTDEQGDVIRALFRLQGYLDAHLLLVRRVDSGILQKLRDAEAAVVAYREADERQGRIQALFALAYLEIALLVLIGSAWLGAAAAGRVSAPIGQLAMAAERVSRGDLSARVDPGASGDEVEDLGHAFNRMTGELQAQREAILSAREDAERRSVFIETVLSGVSAGVLGVGHDGVLTLANRSAGALLGEDALTLAGRRLGDVAPQFEQVAARVRPGAPAAAQVEHVRAGDALTLNVRAAAGAREGELVITFDDVSSLVAAQRQAAWKDVARRIAHEIKNPLTPIQLSAERLKRKYGKDIATDPQTFSKLTDTIVRQVSDIGRMVDEFSAFARMPAPRAAPSDLGELVRQAVFAQRIVSADVDVSAQTPEAPVIVVCDARLIAQALTNVLKNAAEAIAGRRAQGEGDEAHRIAAVLRLAGDHAVIEVTDTGIGLPAKDRARLVEPYITTREKGTGLGLAIVKRILEEHGGRLDLVDPPDGARGALVRLTLPLTPPAADAGLARETA
jgi:two-component system nitrogen regulation sensor histidine kinase NtrY